MHAEHGCRAVGSADSSPVPAQNIVNIAVGQFAQGRPGGGAEQAAQRGGAAPRFAGRKFGRRNLRRGKGGIRAAAFHLVLRRRRRNRARRQQTAHFAGVFQFPVQRGVQRDHTPLELDKQTFHQVFQFADIAGPVVLTELFGLFRREGGRG